MSEKNENALTTISNEQKAPPADVDTRTDSQRFTDRVTEL